MSEECWRGVPRLFSLALSALVDSLEVHAGTLRILPRSIKTRLLTIACKRGKLCTSTWKSLLHCEVRTLNLSECDVNDDQLKAVQVCTQLQTLDLNPGRCDERNLGKEALLSLWPHLPMLKVLYLRRCSSVTDEVVEMLAKSCPNLMELDIGGCHAITDAAPVALTRTLHKLTCLNISGSQVGDEGLLELVQGHCGKTLRELYINNCMRITDFSIQCIAQNCLKMSVLFLQNCPVSEDSHYALENIFAISKVKQLSWTIY